MIKLKILDTQAPVSYLQECRKCHMRQQSDYILFLCQQGNCGGFMTADLQS